MMKHRVRVIWNAANSEQSVTLSVEDCEYEALVANLRWMLGPRWSGVSHDDLSLKDSPDYKNGVAPIGAVQAILRHASPELTQNIYVGLSPEDARTAAEASKVIIGSE